MLSVYIIYYTIMRTLQFKDKKLEIPENLINKSIFLSNAFENSDTIDLSDNNNTTYELVFELISNTPTLNTSFEHNVKLLKCADFLNFDHIVELLTDHLCRLFHKNNALIQIINKHFKKLPDKCFSELINNPNITIEFVIDNIKNQNFKDKEEWLRDKQHEYDITSRNCAISMNDIFSNLDIPWNWEYISYNPNIRIIDILNNIDKPWDWGVLSYNIGIKMDDISSNITLPWDWYFVINNPNITKSFIIENQDKITNESLFKNSNLTMLDFEQSIHIPWNYSELSNNPNLTIDFIKKYPNKKWNWNKISSNPNLTIDFIKEFPDKKWNWDDLTKHKNIQVEDIENNLNLKWNWKKYGPLGNNQNITYEFIKKYDIPETLCTVFGHMHNITVDELVEYYKTHNHWNDSYQYDVYFSKNLTLDYIKNNLDKTYEWNSIVSNSKFNVSELLQIINNSKIKNNLKPEDLKYIFIGIFKNSTITIDIVDKYIDKYGKYGSNFNIFENTFIYENKRQITEKLINLNVSDGIINYITTKYEKIYNN